MDKPDYSIRALKRAYDVLNCFAISSPRKSLKDITRETGLHKSTTFRILETLENFGWVKREDESGLYKLGLGIFELGSKALNNLDFYHASESHLKELVRVSGQSAHLVIQDQGQVLYLNKLEKPGVLITQPSNIGLRLPMHCTAVGKVLLAYIEQGEVEAIIAKRGLKKETPNTISTREGLFRELEDIRRRGYAFDNEEIQPGLRCIAAPIRGYSGKVVAAISISGLKIYFSQETADFLSDEVCKAARAISSEIGYFER